VDGWLGIVKIPSFGGVRLKPEVRKNKGAFKNTRRANKTVTDFFQEPRKENFLRIKQSLDPWSSYIIFENDLKQEGGSIFDPTHIAYAYLAREKIVWQQIIDMDKSHEYLVICINPGKEDQVLGRIMGYGFPENTIYYIYKAKEVRK
jgi:hypothetical protein